MADTLRPFHCGSQWADWQGSNCDRCKKGYDEAAMLFRCDLQESLSGACFGDGTVTAEVGRRIGLVMADGSKNGRYNWPCTEVDWTEDWKKSCVAKQRMN